MIEETDQVPSERRRLVETGGAGAIRGLGAPGVRPSRADMVALAEKILERAT